MCQRTCQSSHLACSPAWCTVLFTRGTGCRWAYPTSNVCPLVMFELTHWHHVRQSCPHTSTCECCNRAAAAQSLFNYHSNVSAVALYICRNTQSCMPGSNSVTAPEHRCGTQSQAWPHWLHQPCTPQQMCQTPLAQSSPARRNNTSAGCTKQQPVPS